MTRPVKRSFSLQGHRTSISLEAPFWDALKDAAAREKISLAVLVARIDAERKGAGLSGAVRIWWKRKPIRFKTAVLNQNNLMESGTLLTAAQAFALSRSALLSRE